MSTTNMTRTATMASTVVRMRLPRRILLQFAATHLTVFLPHPAAHRTLPAGVVVAAPPAVDAAALAGDERGAREPVRGIDMNGVDGRVVLVAELHLLRHHLAQQERDVRAVPAPQVVDDRVQLGLILLAGHQWHVTLALMPQHRGDRAA